MSQDKRKIEITIDGDIGAGKTTIAFAIAHMLANHGVTCRVRDHKQGRPFAVSDMVLGLKNMSECKRKVVIKTTNRKR